MASSEQLEQAAPASLQVLSASSQAPCQPSGLQTTAGRPQAALPPACPQRFKYLLTTWRVPNIYIGWGPHAQIRTPIGSLPLPSRRPIRWEERPVLGGGVITYRHNKLKLKPVCHRSSQLAVYIQLSGGAFLWGINSRIGGLGNKG